MNKKPKTYLLTTLPQPLPKLTIHRHTLSTVTRNDVYSHTVSTVTRNDSESLTIVHRALLRIADDQVAGEAGRLLIQFRAQRCPPTGNRFGISSRLNFSRLPRSGISYLLNFFCLGLE